MICLSNDIDGREGLSGMQLLYGNDGTNYHTIARSQDMSDMQEKELLAGYLGYEFARDPAVYSSAEREPLALTYATTNLSKTLPEEKILFSVSGRMRNYLTPSYWAHFQLLDITTELYGEHFFDLLRRTYIRDTEVNEYLHKDIDTFKGGYAEAGSIDGASLEKDKVTVLVAAVLSVADSLSRQVKVILDVEGDAYNRRALEVITAVYRYIPYHIRKAAGFCTYGKTDRGGSNRVKLFLYTREQAGLLDQDAIDLKNMDCRRELSRIPAGMVELAKVITESKDEVRTGWFETFQKVFGMQNASVEDHIIILKNARKWQEQDLGSIMDEIAAYAYKEQAKQLEAPVYQVFCKIMNKRFLQERYDLKYNELIREILEQQHDFCFDNRMNAYLALGEAINCVSFELSVFMNWEIEKIIEPLKAKYDDEELIAQYKEKYIQLRRSKMRGIKFAEICLRMEEQIKEAVEEARERIKLHTQEEKQKLQAILQSRRLEVCEIENVYSGIKYKSNYEAFSESLIKNVSDYIGSIPLFSSYKAYCDYKAYLAKLQPYLLAAVPEELKKAVEQKGKTVKAMQQCRKIAWNHRSQILDSYQNIYLMRRLQQGKESAIEAPDYEVQIKDQYFEMNETELLALIQFLLSPSDIRVDAVKDMLPKNRKLMEGLMDIEAFDEEHFPYLCRWYQGEAMYRKIIRYYAGGSWMLSKKQIEDAINDNNQRNSLKGNRNKRQERDRGVFWRKRWWIAVAAVVVIAAASLITIVLLVH